MIFNLSFTAKYFMFGLLPKVMSYEQKPKISREYSRYEITFTEKYVSISSSFLNRILPFSDLLRW